MAQAAQLKADGQPDKPLERYFRILEVVASFPSGIGLSQIVEILGLPKTTVHRLLHGLLDVGVLSASEQRAGHYTLGPRLLNMLYVGTPDDWIETLTRALLKDLAEQTGQTCYIAKLTDSKIRSIAMMAPDNLMRGYVVPGRELWPHAAASAKAILAFQSEEVVRRVLPSPLPALTAQSKTRLGDLLSEFETVRETGMALCVNEDFDGFAGVACPIPLPGIGVIYSVALTGTVELLINQNLDYHQKQLKLYAERLASAIQIRLSHLSELKPPPA